MVLVLLRSLFCEFGFLVIVLDLLVLRVVVGLLSWLMFLLVLVVDCCVL